MKKNNSEKMTKKERWANITLDGGNSIFNNVQMCTTVYPSILTTPALRLIEEDFKGAIQEGPTYICDIC